ncbi:GTPase HflX [Candidatus Nitrospira nitrificans]|uniref:GTPase HflX n=1 Tax=Candidatus Nitrospira nitrificans TaxID=1742973 RepID=A0A0S4LN26_9BACT|nr:GTPase HflX [Candidatus Nitrospira nitrificans]CUS38983.1 GTPase HflX [Candidatus Nitrospira nitrificans]
MSTPSQSRVVLVAIQTPRVSREELDSSLQELTRLVKTLGHHVVGRVMQKRSSDTFSTVLGQGKLAELARWTGGLGTIAASFERPMHKAASKRAAAAADEAEDSEEGESDEPSETSPVPRQQAQIVIVDCDLSPSQLKNLERAAGVPVLDRTGVIIEIFSRHARTRAARLQVEIARLNYLAPRLRETGGGSERQSGGIGGKGAGETSLELDKRRIRDRIKALRAELAAIGDEHHTRRARREHELTVALVGYTNAGKSSLMRAMTGIDVLVADKLFATLDTTIRPLHPETRPKVLMTDTVGFIKKLPHDLVASFKSTLDEAAGASLVLFVVDASDPSFRSQLDVTRTVLAEVGATDIPSLLVLNKQDRLGPDALASLKVEYPQAFFLSTRSTDDLNALRERIMRHFENEMIDEEFRLPFTAQAVLAEIRARMRILSEDYDAEGFTIRVRSTPENLTMIKKKLAR